MFTRVLNYDLSPVMVPRLITTEFSEDSSILAGGFSESYIRLWNLRGDPMEPVISDFDATSMQTSEDLRKLQKRTVDNNARTATTRKLVAHSGPVYSMSFDPLPGPSGPPRFLLSASQDSTVRLWSLDTYSNIVAYRGHRDPVWDVEWGPRGVYFASTSRDRTARLWTTERIAAVRIFAGHLSDVNVSWSVRYKNDWTCTDISHGRYDTHSSTPVCEVPSQFIISSNRL